MSDHTVITSLISSNWCKSRGKNGTCQGLEKHVQTEGKKACTKLLGNKVFVHTVPINGQIECAHSLFDENTISNHID